MLHSGGFEQLRAPGQRDEQCWREIDNRDRPFVYKPYVSRFALMDLAQRGAPPELIEAANSDSLDEIRHADLCFSIARALDGRSESPAPFPAARHAAACPRCERWRWRSSPSALSSTALFTKDCPRA